MKKKIFLALLITCITPCIAAAADDTSANDTVRQALKMKLKEGYKDSLVKYYEETWPSIEAQVKEAGVFDYSVFLDTTNNYLFVVNKYYKGKTFQELTNEWEKGMSKYLEPVSGDSLYVHLDEFMYINDLNNASEEEVDAKRFAFRMNVKQGYEEEIKRRQTEKFVWPTVKNLLSEYGVYDYAIYWDEETHYLYAVQRYLKDRTSQDNEEIDPDMQLWWDMQADLMDTYPNNSPVSIELEELFHAE